MLEQGSGMERDPGRVVEIYWLCLSTSYRDEGAAALSRLWPDAGPGGEAARLATRCLAWRGAARRSSHTTEQLVALAIAGGAD